MMETCRAFPYARPRGQGRPVVGVTMIRQSTGILVAGVTAPAAAQTRCASRADLPGGIVVTYDGGAVDTFTADAAIPGAVIWQGDYQGMSLGTTVLAQGYIYLSSVSPANGGEEVLYDYGILPADLPFARVENPSANSLDWCSGATPWPVSVTLSMRGAGDVIRTSLTGWPCVKSMALRMRLLST